MARRGSADGSDLARAMPHKQAKKFSIVIHRYYGEKNLRQSPGNGNDFIA
jgi:hypothetical protein